ncbi:hypothetical protein DFH05DRAFT_1525301 [Lentinula detonsa]|uniref:Uncharacterized protein n=1 Tax=Lentinula detonsa TaxID=2804962 RepID=A0A9W8P0A4_9AGAR|nr:hypothetical protein DFH05DRAFT_1525301 [Lentinula detonsa]
MPPLGVNETLRKEQYPPLFREILLELLAIFRGEQRCRNEGGIEQVPKFISQVVDYAYGRAPFTLDSSHNIRSLDPLKYWTKLQKDSGAKYLSNVGIKVFSITPSEICDERQASRLGWLDNARRASITPENLINSAKMYECFAFGLDEKPSAHKARHRHFMTLNSENVDPTSLNKATLEDSWFNNPDPYDISEVDRADETEAEALLDMSTVRSSTRFAISQYIQLSDPSLIKILRNENLNEETVALDDGAMQLDTQPGDWDAISYL